MMNLGITLDPSWKVMKVVWKMTLRTLSWKKRCINNSRGERGHAAWHQPNGSVKLAYTKYYFLHMRIRYTRYSPQSALIAGALIAGAYSMHTQSIVILLEGGGQFHLCGG